MLKVTLICYNYHGNSISLWAFLYESTNAFRFFKTWSISDWIQNEEHVSLATDQAQLLSCVLRIEKKSVSTELVRRFTFFHHQMATKFLCLWEVSNFGECTAVALARRQVNWALVSPQYLWYDLYSVSLVWPIHTPGHSKSLVLVTIKLMSQSFNYSFILQFSQLLFNLD